MNSAIAIILGTIIVIIVAILFQSEWFNKIMIKIFHKTVNDNIWRDIIDFSHGSNLKVYVKDKDYYILGHHKGQEEKGNDSWIALSAFVKYDKETNKKYKNEPDFSEKETDTPEEIKRKQNTIITIRLEDIEHIEIFN